MLSRWKITWPYILLVVMIVLAGWSSWRHTFKTNPSQASSLTQAKTIDPVCHMQVNTKWDYHEKIDGKDYYFCGVRCEDLFKQNAKKYITAHCLVCKKPIAMNKALTATYMKHTYYMDTQACRSLFKKDPAAYFMHRMWGIPDWLYYLCIALVLLVSFVKFEGFNAFKFRRRRTPNDNTQPTFDGQKNANHAAIINIAATGEAVHLPIIEQASSCCSTSSHGHNGDHEADSHRYHLAQHEWLNKIFRSRPIRFAFQLVMAFLFLVIIAAGLFGNQNPSLNIAPLVTWTIWWCGLVVLIMYFGKAWCYMCPWDAIAGWVETLHFWKKTDESTGLKLPWPKAFRNIWLATALFVGLTWVEIGFGVTNSPRVTAWLAIGMLVLAVTSAMVFDRKSFCRYGCLVGRVSGLYALFAGVEVRHQDESICKTCHTKECIKGSDTAYGCPTFEYPGKMESNTYCIQCMECVQACPHDNMGVNLRPWASDLASGQVKARSDEAYLALIMLAISGFHGLTMTAIWGQINQALQRIIPGGEVVVFTLSMVLLLAFPILLYALFVKWSYHIAIKTKSSMTADLSYRDYFIRYAYCVLPIALFYHLAHNLEHLLMEGPKIVSLISDPFGWHWNLFGTATWQMAPLTSLDMLWIMQVILVGVGHVYSLWIAQKISRRTFNDPVAASRSQWPLLLGMIAFSIFSLWLLKQPMEMRTSVM